MSTIITTDIQCDACPTWDHGVVHPSKTRTRAARNRLAERGWKRANDPDASGWIDLCPDCAQERKSEQSARTAIEQIAPLLRDIRNKLGSVDATCEVTGLSHASVSSITYERHKSVSNTTADVVRRTWVSLFGDDQLCFRCAARLDGVAYDDGDGEHLCSDCFAHRDALEAAAHTRTTEEVNDG